MFIVDKSFKYDKWKLIMISNEGILIVLRSHCREALLSILGPGIDRDNCSQIHSQWLGDTVDSGIGLSYRPAILYWLTGRYDNPMPESTISPSQGLWIWLLERVATFLTILGPESGHDNLSEMYSSHWPKYRKKTEKWKKTRLKISTVRENQLKSEQQ